MARAISLFYFKVILFVLSFFFICEAKKKESTKERRKHAVKWITNMPEGHLFEWMLQASLHYCLRQVRESGAPSPDGEGWGGVTLDSSFFNQILNNLACNNQPDNRWHKSNTCRKSLTFVFNWRFL